MSSRSPIAKVEGALQAERLGKQGYYRTVSCLSAPFFFFDMQQRKKGNFFRLFAVCPRARALQPPFQISGATPDA